ncbi:MAG: hypothetical protein J6128_00595 [Clostridia bacterium]|nr:hypothetical protein [Clostridia bacterium]
MKTFSCTDHPLKVFGVPGFEKTHRFVRLPDNVRTVSSGLNGGALITPGARIGFRTDSPEFTVRVFLKTLSRHEYLGRGCAQSVSVMTGDRKTSFFSGTLCPPDYSSKCFEGTFRKKPVMEDVTLWLPGKEQIENVEVSFDDDSVHVEDPTPYRFSKAVFYGSSITEGNFSSTPANDYVALLSRWFDLDFYNLGFNGSARGEQVMAEYISMLKDEMIFFVCDYDENAPNPEFLEKTHEDFFKTIRRNCPDLPVLFLSRPDFYLWSSSDECRNVIYRTYSRARARGDKNVYFVDGEKMFGTVRDDRYLCTVDGVHPNDLGFYRMASAIRPVMARILEHMSQIKDIK